MSEQGKFGEPLDSWYDLDDDGKRRARWAYTKDNKRLECETVAIMKRVIDCWGACAGMDDPAAEIAAKDARIAELEAHLALFDKNPTDKMLMDEVSRLIKVDEENAELRSALAASKAREGEAVEVIKQCRQLNSEEKTWTEGAKGHEAMTIADKFLTRLKERQ